MTRAGRRRWSLAVATLALGLAAARGDAGPDAQLPSLREAFRGEFRIGAAVTGDLVRDPTARRFLERQFDVVVTESEMKPLVLAPREGQYDFAAADAIVDWANRRGIKVRGNCLVWHRQEIPWMFTQDGRPASRDVLVRRLRTYVHDVVGHFKGRVWAWDVVNEAFTAGEVGAEATHGWRRSGWYDALGPEYVALAFQFAHEADPGALLFYNDYETQNPARRAMILDLVRSLQGRGISIDGIGHQAHYTATRPVADELETTLREVARLGLRNHVTELDITLRDHLGVPVPPPTPALLAEQTRRWTELFAMFRRNADRIDAVVLWGVNDERSWLGPPDQPLLFQHFQPKPAFWAVLGVQRR